MNQLGIAALVVFLGVWWAVYVYRRIAIQNTWFDIPNRRSSHAIPTPVGAGIALALVLLPIQYILLGTADAHTAILLALSGLMAGLGWLDDRYGLPTLLRALCFLLAAITVSLFVLAPAWPVVLVAVIGVFFYINFFNFMDGTDGIAAAQGLFVAGGFMLFSSGDGTVFPLAATLAAGCLAFLYWNWAPAKVFMGDAGSLFLGFYLATLALVAHANGVVHISVSLVLSILFIVEPLTVVISRAAAGADITQAHRSHIYQLLAVRWGSHQPVVLCYLLVNCTLVLPLAWYLRAKSTEGTIITVCVYILGCLIVAILRHRLLLSASEKI